MWPRFRTLSISYSKIFTQIRERFEEIIEGLGLTGFSLEGEFAQIGFHWNDVTRTLTIDAREGNYPGMLLSRQFRIHVVSAASEAGDKEASTFQKTVNYEGEAMSVTL